MFGDHLIHSYPSPRISHFIFVYFDRRIGLGTKIWVLSVLVAQKAVSASKPSQLTEQSIQKQRHYFAN